VLPLGPEWQRVPMGDNSDEVLALVEDKLDGKELEDLREYIKWYRERDENRTRPTKSTCR
jgi:hypothetical protein